MHDVPARPPADRPPPATGSTPDARCADGPGDPDGPDGWDGFGGRYDFWIPAQRASVREARRRLRDLMTVWEPWDADTAAHFTDSGCLVLSELVTNAVVHAHGRAGGRVHIRVRYGPPGLQVEVSDPGGGAVPGGGRGQDGGRAQDGGRGGWRGPGGEHGQDGRRGPGGASRISEEFPEGGRGLEIVNALAVSWGWRPRVGRPGRTVWALVAPLGIAG
ncbi:ATP-binding protein [Kitasatospora sp. NPDC051914]|uniref:ATP-binding protein n=1 Tax=Kitasatospora sp. NPDC051914 TaxID=3154945 RepID=UPI003421C7BD